MLKEDYLGRPFVAWDGEGITDLVGDHYYTLFANSLGDTLVNPDGIPSIDIFRFLTETECDPESIHVIYGGSYDFNLWIRDLPLIHVDRLYTLGRVMWGRWAIEWRRGKYFRIRNMDSGRRITIYDVVSFFQRPFVGACDEYLGNKFAHRDLIVENKALRSSFTLEDAETVMIYNQAELDNLVMLASELRARLDKVGIRIKRWDGPGAIAAAILTQEGVKHAMTQCPEPVAEAGRFAYFGGRFEVLQFGDSHDVAYEYDINSAYPHALRKVPNLAHGQWVWDTALPDFDTFGVYRVRYQASLETLNLPQPLPCRAPDGTVSYPYNLVGWYWASEIVNLDTFCRIYGGRYEILDGWVFHPTSDDSPFSFIEPMYRKRRALKKAGDGAHVGLKLGLNSLYGKTCQRIGYRLDDKGNPVKPPFHQLEWAGYVTAYTRATIYRAVMPNLESVIAFETDAVFVTEPLPVKVGSNLGEWEPTIFNRLCYLQSGFYFGEVDGKLVEKTRGVDRGSLTYDDVLQARADGTTYVEASLTRFNAYGIARQLNDMDRWCRWETSPKNVTMQPTGKREHAEPCYGCVTGTEWHQTLVPAGIDRVLASCEYPLPWINPNPAMSSIDEMADDVRDAMSEWD